MKLIRRTLPLLFLLLIALAAMCGGGTMILRAHAQTAVASVDGTEYSTLSEALSAWANGSTLILLNDVSSSSVIEAAGSKTLNLNGKTLTRSGTGRTLSVSGTLTITNGSAAQGGMISGGGVRVRQGATLELLSGSIARNTAEDGGGVYIESGGTFRMRGGSVTENSVSGHGGGIYAAGDLLLSGAASVLNNTAAGGAVNNVYVVAGVQMQVSALVGEVGVTAANGMATVAKGDANAPLRADDRSYTITFWEGAYSVSLSPLTAILPSLAGEEEVYPTTSLDALKERIQIEATNANGAPYAGRLGFTLSGTLNVGGSELTVVATGEGAEQVSAVLAVSVSVPAVQAISVLYEQGDTVIYFDSPLQALTEGLTVYGTYSDGLTRVILPTAEQTAAQGEAYITDHYQLVGNLAIQADGVAQITVSVLGSRVFSQSFAVNVSKYVLSAEEIAVHTVTVIGGAAAAQLTGEAFAPSLPQGIRAVALIDGAPLAQAAVQPGIYAVTLRFEVVDSANYQAVEGERQAQLIVNALSLEGEIEGGGSYTLTAEGGVPPTWRLTVRNAEGANGGLDSSLDALAAIEVSLSDDDLFVTSLDRAVTLHLTLEERLQDKQIRLFCVLSDGSLVELETQREGDVLTFELRSAVQTQYILAADNAFGSYLIATIIFGVACVAGAALLIWYFVKRKNLRIR